MFCRYLIFLILILIGTPGGFATGAAAENSSLDTSESLAPDIVKLSAHAEWRALLHYEKNIFGGVRSLVDDAYFFVDEANGPTSPAHELIATITALQDGRRVGRLQTYVVCAYPARVRFLSRHLKATWPSQNCADLEAWRGRIGAIESVSLIFATAYWGNVASAFGHTLLRLDSRAAHKGSNRPLLSWGVNYAAKAPDHDNNLQYFYKGIFGGYHGEFSVWPYYEKVREYRDIESRDLWEYTFQFSDEEMRRLLDHLWEISNVRLRYYFFGRNCSYELLALLNAAKPEWRLTSEFRSWVLPVNTLRSVLAQIESDAKLSRWGHSPGHSSATSPNVEPFTVAHRASLYSQVLSHLRGMSAIEREQYEYGVKHNFLLSSDSEFIATQKNNLSSNNEKISAEPSAKVYEALLAAQTFRYGDTQTFDAEQRVRQSKLFAGLARVALPTQALMQRTAFDRLYETDKRARPDRGHPSMKASLYVGGGDSYAKREDHHSFGGLVWRPTLHDFLDGGYGHEAFSEIALLQTDLRYTKKDGHEEGVVKLHQLDLMKTQSLNPVDALQKDVSWSVLAQIYTPPQLNCGACHAERLTAGVGYSVLPVLSREKMLLYGLLKINGERLDHQWQAGPGAELGVKIIWSERIKFSAVSENKYNFVEYGQVESTWLHTAQLSYHIKRDMEIRAESLWAKTQDSAHQHRLLYSFYW